MKIIDFTKKGTKLPVIPVGTKFKWLNKGFFTEPCKSNKKGTCKELNFISGGTYQNNNIIYVICDDQSTVKFGMEYLIKLSTIERLAKEQGMYNTNNEIEMKTEFKTGDYVKVIRDGANASAFTLKIPTCRIKGVFVLH